MGHGPVMKTTVPVRSSVRDDTLAPVSIGAETAGSCHLADAKRDANMEDTKLILSQLERVTNSHAFRFADRQRSFLRYVVTETLQNRADRLKEYVIGIEVFGKPTTFDPRLDSIVRTEAHKLRAKLARYFDTEGKSDPIRIELPRGKYSPVFAPAAAVAAATAPTPRWRREPSSLRVLVLPFGSPGAAQSEEQFGDALTDELGHALSATPGIEVVARSCALQFKGQAVDICEVACRLNVHAVIEGSVHRVGDRVRILAQLDDPTSGCTIWSQSYERQLGHSGALEQELARLITSQLLSKIQVHKTPHDRPAVQLRLAGAEAQMEAQQHYLQGLRHFARQAPDDVQEASRLFNLAVEKDTRLTVGYTHLAYSHLFRPVLLAVLPAEPVSHAFLAARRALEIDPLTGAAHIALALERLQAYQWHEADEQFRKGLELSPADAVGHSWYGIFLASFGRTAEALKHHELAMENEPEAAMSASSYGLTLFLMRHYSEAARQYCSALARHPTSLQAITGLGMVFLQQGDYDSAIAQLERAQGLTFGLARDRAKLGYAYALAGAKERARSILNELLDLANRASVPGHMLAELYIGLGDVDNAFKWLHTAIDQRDIPAMLRCDPMFDSLRGDHRFGGLLEHQRMS